jgi:hypothetical protein
MTVAFLGVLLAINVALRALPLQRRGEDPLTAVECAFLRGGIRAAVLVAHAVPADDGADAIEAFELAVADAGDPPTGRWGIARRRGVRRAAADVRERLIGWGLMAPTGHFAIARCVLLAVPVVAAVALFDESLGLTTLIGSAVATVLAVTLWFAPRRTIAGWRALRAERRRYVQVTLAATTPPDTAALAMLVALHGRPALDILSQQSRPDPPPVEPSSEPSIQPSTQLATSPSAELSTELSAGAVAEVSAEVSDEDDSPLTPRRLML